MKLIRFKVMLRKVRKLLEQGVQHGMHCPPALFGKEGPLPSSICTEVAPEHRLVCLIRMGLAELAELVGRVVAKEEALGKVVHVAFETPYNEEEVPGYVAPCSILTWREYTIVCSLQRVYAYVPASFHGIAQCSRTRPISLAIIEKTEHVILHRLAGPLCKTALPAVAVPRIAAWLAD